MLNIFLSSGVIYHYHHFIWIRFLWQRRRCRSFAPWSHCLFVTFFQWSWLCNFSFLHNLCTSCQFRKNSFFIPRCYCYCKNCNIFSLLKLTLILRREIFSFTVSVEEENCIWDFPLEMLFRKRNVDETFSFEFPCNSNFSSFLYYYPLIWNSKLAKHVLCLSKEAEKFFFVCLSSLAR